MVRVRTLTHGETLDRLSYEAIEFAFRLARLATALKMEAQGEPAYTNVELSANLLFTDLRDFFGRVRRETRR